MDYCSFQIQKTRKSSAGFKMIQKMIDVYALNFLNNIFYMVFIMVEGK